MEALINIATGTSSLQGVHLYGIRHFSVNTSACEEAMTTVYDTVYQFYRNFWLSKDTSETYPYAVHISVDSTSGQTAFLRAIAIVSRSNTCLTQKYAHSPGGIPCDPFDEEEAYRVGAGDEELSLIFLYVNPPCENPCGNTPPCEAGPSTAYEVIEDCINHNYPLSSPPCSPNHVLAGWVNVRKSLPFYITPNSFLAEDCPFTDFQKGGTCMNNDELNCVYCSIYEQIASGLEPFVIPSGQKFISINLGVDFCFCGGSGFCGYTTRVMAEYYYGMPVCRPITTPGETWGDPLYFNLSQVTF